jgi:hypothetical protein
MCQCALQEVFFRKATVRQKTYSLYCNSILPQAGEATESVGLNHSSVDSWRKPEGAKGSGYLVKVF